MHASTAAARLPQRLLSARATTWHAPTPCFSSPCTGNALAVHAVRPRHTPWHAILLEN